METSTAKKSKKKISPPFGYFGAKNKIALQICNKLPPHNCWVEAFCGSAALTLRKAPAPIEIINDINSDIVNLFEQLRNNTEELCRLIALTPYAEEELILARQVSEPISKVEKARTFLIKSMMAINGVFGEEKGGFSYSDSYSRNGRDARVNRWYNLPERLTSVVERLKDVRVENKNAIQLIKRYENKPATLIYLDPPYLGERTNGYDIDANCEDFHRELLDVANSLSAMVLISGYDNKLYKTLLSSRFGWRRRTIETSTKDSTGSTHKRIEVLWMNKHFQSALKSKKIPIELTQKEKKANKVNPER